MSVFGKVVFKGAEYTLQQDAYVENYGTAGQVRYYATALDADGGEHMVAWETTEEWDSATALYQQALTDATDECGNIKDMPDCGILDDESYACDWDNPVEVVAV